MRKKTLSDQGVKMFLNGLAVERPQKNFRQLVWNLFHSDYDESLERVVNESMESSKALSTVFGSDSFEKSLSTSVSQAVKLILTYDQKKMTRRQLNKNVKFFVDVMNMSFTRGDYQTAHLFLFALSHPIITNLNYKIQKWGPEKMKEIKHFLGGPTYNYHIKFWETVCDDKYLPSLFAFYNYIERCHWQGKINDMNHAQEMIDLFKFLNYSSIGLTDIYKQDDVSRFELQQLSSKFK